MLAIGTGAIGTIIGTGQRSQRWCQIDGWVKDTCHRQDHPCCPVCGTPTARTTASPRPQPRPTLTAHAHAPHQPAVGSAHVTVTVVPGTTEAHATVEVTGSGRIQQLAAGIGLAGAAASVIAAQLAAAVRALSAEAGSVPVTGRVIAGEIADRPAEEVQR